ncbi:hypothetical protein KFU94_58290 [Chloroflexi bacterium TSY]|nr:hypothetical protein [Chloroflexi bacterium TSY]
MTSLSIFIFLFGSPRASRNREAVPLTRCKAIALLAYLALHDKWHRRERLTTLLWPDATPHRAFANLRQLLWLLNRDLREGWLLANQEMIRLNLQAGLWVDVRHFQHLLTQTDRDDTEMAIHS